MRNLLTTTAVILALSAATPVLAAGYNNHGNNAPQPAPAYSQPAKFDHGNHGNKDWGREWQPRQNFRFFAREILIRAKLTRRLEQQGYYRVSNLTPAAFGNAWRATAMYRGHRVIVRVDQFSGRVLGARYI